MHDISQEATFIRFSNIRDTNKNISIWKNCIGVANMLLSLSICRAFDCYTLLAKQYIYISQRS